MSHLKSHIEHRTHGNQMEGKKAVPGISTSEKQQQPSPCKENISAFIESWQKYDRAGSYLVSSICQFLPGPWVESTFGSSITTALFSGSVSEQALGHLRELQHMLSSHQAEEGGNDLKSDQSQLHSQALLLLVKQQADYHKQRTQSLTCLIEQLIHSCDKNDNPELFHYIRSLELHKYASSRQSPSRSFGLKKPSAAGSNSPKSQKHSIKSSLFSFFERKNSPDESTSSFYVDLNPADDETIQSQPVSHPEKLDNSQSETLIQIGLDPAVSSEGSANILNIDSHKNVNNALVTVPGTILLDGLELPTTSVYQGLSLVSASQGPDLISSSGATGFPSSANGHVASQEELDSVINLLSGVGAGSSVHMSPIPEQQGQVSLQVPPGYGSLSPAVSDSCMDGVNTQRSQAQRRSEGSLDLSGFGNPGRNTWPHRSSLPGAYLVAQVQYDHMNNAHPRNYMPENRPAMTLPPGGASHLPPGYQWGFPDSKLNRTWPVNNLAGSSTWSAGQESDDLSDDDSSSDQFYNITQQLQPKISMDDTVSTCEKLTADTGGRHHSFEDILDPHSADAWQAPVQPWSQSAKSKEPVMSHDMTRNSGYHKPLTMQWSDPLSSRNMWPSAGLEPQKQIQSQSAHGFGGPI